MPVDAVKRSLGQLRRDGKARYAYLGVSTTQVYPQLDERFGLGDRPRRLGAGASCRAARRTRRAWRRPTTATRFQEQRLAHGGDVITRSAAARSRDADDLAQVLDKLEPGDEGRGWRSCRDGDERRTVKLGDAPHASARLVARRRG